MSIKTDAIVIRDETIAGANTATRVGTNLVDIADDLVAKQAAIDLNNDKVGITPTQASDIVANNAKVGVTNEEANPDVVGQAEAEAGTSTTERTWTAERVKQAIDALGGSGSVDDTAYDVSWNGVTTKAPSQNALYDFIESQVFKVDENSNIVPIFWGGNQTQYDAYFNITDFPSGVPNNYFTVITDGAVSPTTASDIVFVPNGSISSTDVQAAIQEVRDEAVGGTMTDAEVKTAYENNADTNAFTDSEKVIVGNTSGTNTGDNAVNTLYSGLTTNATHTGEVTGNGALTLDATAISNKTLDSTPATTAEVLINDAGTLKKTTIADLGSLNLYEVKLHLTSMAFTGGNYTTELVAAQGAGKTIIPERIVYKSVGLSSGGGNSTLTVRYNGDSSGVINGGLISPATGGFAMGSYGGATYKVSVTTENTSVNLVITNGTDPTITGDLFVKLLYSVVDSTDGF